MSKTDLTAARAYSITEAADIKGVSPNTIRRAIKATEGEMPPGQDGRQELTDLGVCARGLVEPGGTMSTKRRMTWKTGIPFIILCIIIGLLVGWLADRASATVELIPVSDNVASVDTPRQGVRKFKRERLGRARRHQGYSAQQKDVILDKLMRLQRRQHHRGISARTLTRRGMWRNFTSHDNCFYKVSGGSPNTAVWTCQGSVRQFPGAAADWRRRDVRALLCSGVAGISVGGALAAGAGGPWIWAGIGVGWALCVWQQKLEAMADN